MDDEALPHVLDHCGLNMVLIRQCRNKIVERLTNAVSSGKITTDRSVAESNSRLRPDIVISERNKVTIIDICCPFDNGSEALAEAEQQKINKYASLKDHFIARGLKCKVFGFVIGALGSWHPNYEHVLNRVGMTKSYKNLSRKLCCTDVIQGSTDIYRHHLGLKDV